MGTEESNRFATPHKFLVPQDETLNKPLPPHWSTSMQAYHNSGSTPTPFLNSYAAGSYFCHYRWPNEANSTSLQYDSLHDPRRLSNYPTVSGGAALTFSEKVQRSFGEKNLELMKKCDRNLQPKSLIIKESIENGNRSSIPKNDREGVSLSAASGSKGSPDEGDDANNDFSSTKNQQCNMILGNGEDAQKVTGIENCSAVCANRNLASHHFAANSTKLNQNLGTGLNASGANAQLALLEEDEIRKERKRQSNRESAKRSRIRKQQECEELRINMDILRDENSSLTHRLKRISEDCLKLNIENESIEEEMVKMYGPDSIADLMPVKPSGGRKEATYN